MHFLIPYLLDLLMSLCNTLVDLATRHPEKMARSTETAIVELAAVDEGYI